MGAVLAMAYKYNSWRHSLRTEINDRHPATPWEVAIYSANSGRKLKVYGRFKTKDAAQACSGAVQQRDLANK
jgi:hypothetical protein